MKHERPKGTNRFGRSNNFYSEIRNIVKLWVSEPLSLSSKVIDSSVHSKQLYWRSGYCRSFIFCLPLAWWKLESADIFWTFWVKLTRFQWRKCWCCHFLWSPHQLHVAAQYFKNKTGVNQIKSNENEIGCDGSPNSWREWRCPCFSIRLSKTALVIFTLELRYLK